MQRAIRTALLTAIRNLGLYYYTAVYQGSGVKLVGDGSSHHYKDPSERGKKQEMVAPVFQGSGVKLLGDRSSHHYKDPSKRGKEARDDCTYILRI